MKLGRDELERSVAQFRMPEPAMDRLVARRRRHSQRDRAAAAIVAIAVLSLALAVLGRSFMTTQPATRNDHPAPPWRTADVDGITFTNPGGWHLTGYFDGTAKLAAIGSFSPNLSGSDPCDGMPNDGAILVIDPLAGGRAPAWPTDLADGPIASEHACGSEHLGARWSADGQTYKAVASFGDAVSPATRDALMRAFSGLSFVRATNATSSSSCFVKDGYPALVGEVIAGDTTSDLPWTVYQLGTGSGCLPEGGVELVTADPGISSRHCRQPSQEGRAWMSMTPRWAKAHTSRASSASMCQRWSSRSLMDLESVRHSRHSHPSSPIGRSTSRRSRPFNKVSSRRWQLMDRRCCGQASGRGWIVRTGVRAASVSARGRRSLRARMPLRPIDSWR